MAQFPFMLNSQEFQVFARPTGEIEKVLKSMVEQPSSEIVSKIREATSVDENAFDLIEKDKMEQ
jgi:hypothetical protein